MSPTNEKFTLTDLLAWATKNSSTIATEPDPHGSEITTEHLRNREPLDPALIDAILGEDQVKLMNDAAKIFSNRELTNEERENAMLEFEDLVLDIDNANNIDKLKLWPCILKVLTCKEETECIRTLAIRIVVAAIQNNTESAQTFVESYNGLELLLELFKENLSPGFASRLVSALSWTIRHNHQTLTKFFESHGMDILKNLILEHDQNLRLRVVFMFVNLLMSDSPDVRLCTLEAIIEYDLHLSVIKIFTDDHVELKEKCVEFIKKFSAALNEFKRDDTPRLNDIKKYLDAFIKANPIDDIDADLNSETEGT